MRSVQKRLERNEDPEAILSRLREIEERFGDSFSRPESRIFLRVRGNARIRASDYRGALDDYRALQKMGLQEKLEGPVADTIAQLEAAVAAENAQAAVQEGTSEDEIPESPAEPESE